MIYVFGALLLISVILAVRSMKDFEIPKEINRMISSRNLKGTIVFFKNKPTHYSSKKS